MNLIELWKQVKSRSNVIGYSKKLRPRIRNGKSINKETCFRVYVTVKLPLSSLKLEDIIPDKLEGISTDIVEIGKIEALENTERFRPLVGGISIGNWSITAGTIGWFFKDGKGQEMIGSNAHVLAEDALKETSSETRIVQPGRYDGGTLKDVVAEYFWHKPIGNKSDCTLSKSLISNLNRISMFLNRKSRFPVPMIEEAHHIDFALANPKTEIKFSMEDLAEFDGFLGLGFAGSDQSSIFCKTKYIEAEGWFPIDKKTTAININDVIHKVGRTTEYTKGKVIDDSAFSRVQYSDFDIVEFDDIILTEAMLEGGDSGSAGWLIV